MKKKGFKFLKDIATADVAFEAYGKTIAELFENTAAALLAVSVDPDSLNNLRKRHQLSLQSNNIENLLYDFLSELIFLKDTDGFLASKTDVTIKQTQEGWHLTAILEGERLDPKKHDLRVDVKAVTKHLFRIRKTRDGYAARVVVDI